VSPACRMVCVFRYLSMVHCLSVAKWMFVCLLVLDIRYLYVLMNDLHWYPPPGFVVFH